MYVVKRDAEASLRLRWNLIVEERASGEVIGSVGLHAIDTTPDGAHYGLGYFLRPESWNRGYATEAARAALSWNFEEASEGMAVVRYDESSFGGEEAVEVLNDILDKLTTMGDQMEADFLVGLLIIVFLGAIFGALLMKVFWDRMGR